LNTRIFPISHAASRQSDYALLIYKPQTLNPQTLNPTKVLQRRRGNPITLSIIYMAVARRVGVSINGINAPRHFLVRVEV
jgi:regulator of sirC expression with transglutaminase-like and TPR domain